MEYKEDALTLYGRVCHDAGEVWSVAPHFHDPAVLATVYTSSAKNQIEIKAAVWAVDDYDDPKKLDLRFDFDEGKLERDGRLKELLWAPRDGARDGFAITLADRAMRMWDVDEECCVASPKNAVTNELSGAFLCAAWDPHHANEFLVGTANGTIGGYDLRSMKMTRKIPKADIVNVLDIDYNPNKPYYVVCGGGDAHLKFFDVRKIHRPVKILGEHDFWINKTRYNPFHDQLVLSTGSDEQVMLWRASSVSSAPVLDADSNET